MEAEPQPTAQDLVGTWTIDPAHSMVEFSAKHMMISTVRGRFDDVAGAFTIDPDVSKSSVEVTIKTTSLSTNNPDRDAHLKSADFLEVESYPEMTFTSTAVELVSADEGTFKLSGDLTVRGTTLPVTLDGRFEGLVTKDLWGKTRSAFSARGTFNRKDYKLTWNRALETGGVLVGDRVDVDLSVAAVKDE